MGLGICHLGAGKGKEEEKKRPSEFSAHCNEMITDGVTRLAKERQTGSFRQGVSRLPGEDEASGHMRLLHGLIHDEISAYRQGKMITTILYKGKITKQQELCPRRFRKMVFRRRRSRYATSWRHGFAAALAGVPHVAGKDSI